MEEPSGGIGESSQPRDSSPDTVPPRDNPSLDTLQVENNPQPRDLSLNILLVENDLHVVGTFRELAVGHEVWNYRSTKATLERLKTGMQVYSDVLIMDEEEITKLDAFDFSKHVVKNSDVVVILTSITCSHASKMKVIDCGVSDLWLKPFSENLILAMEVHVQRKRLASLGGKSTYTPTCAKTTAI